MTNNAKYNSSNETKNYSVTISKLGMLWAAVSDAL